MGFSKKKKKTNFGLEKSSNFRYGRNRIMLLSERSAAERFRRVSEGFASGSMMRTLTERKK